MSVTPTVVFTCNWGGLSCFEAAARKGLAYPSSVKIIRVGCVARIQPGLLLKAFELGAQGVMLLGCSAENCQSENGDRIVDSNLHKAWDLMALLGIDREKLKLVRLEAGDGEGFVKEINGFIGTGARS